MKTYMFPGQGAQSKGMGAGLFERFKELTEKADDILGYSIKELCLDDPRNELGYTQFTQPALYVVNALSYFAKVEDSAQEPDFLAGHSLGEFNGLMAAGCFDFETGLKLVQKRGELMSRVSNGAMAAVVNASKEQIEEILERNALKNVHLANYNTPSQIVLSGLADEIEKGAQFFQSGKIRYYPLATSGAFHSPLMRDAMNDFREFLQGVVLGELKIPVIANVTARPYEDGKILDVLSSQIASTVRWSESIQYLLALAASRGEAAEFEEVGNGDVLSRLFLTIKAQTPEPLLHEIAGANFPSQGGAGPKGTDAAGKVTAWNKAHPVGTRCESTVLAGEELETRTEAVVLFGHRAAVYMKGFNGYFDLNELVPAR